MRERVLGQVQVGEVSAAASQQGPEQLAEKQRDMKRQMGCVKFTAAKWDCVV